VAVDALVVARQLVGDHLQVSAYEAVDDLARRQDDAAQVDQALAQSEAAPLSFLVACALVDEQVFESSISSSRSWTAVK